MTFEQFAQAPATQEPSSFVNENNLVSLNKSHKPDLPEKREHGFVENIFDGFMTVAVENTVNSVTQIANKVTGLHIPDLDIVDDPDAGSAGGFIGEVAGGVVKLAGTAVAVAATMPFTATIGGAMAAGATTGALYNFFTPVKEEGNFFYNKVADTAIGGATGAAFGGAAKWLGGVIPRKVVDQIGEQSTYAITRSLVNDVKLGGGAGAIAGIVNAEANAILHENDLFPIGDLVVGGLVGGITGGAFGAAQHGMRSGVMHQYANLPEDSHVGNATRAVIRALTPYGQY